MLEAALPGFLIGVANAAHCAGMCGVFAAQAAGTCSRGKACRNSALYLLGKTATYAFIGALAGFLGARVLDVTGDTRSALGIAAGIALVLVGIGGILGSRGETPIGRWIARLVGPLVRTLRQVHRGGGPLALGAISGLLPCGVVYLAALQGAALANPLDGAVLMSAFGLGTVPVLLAVGLAGRELMARLGPRRVQLAGAVLIVLTGSATIVRALLPWILADGSGGPICCH